MVNGVGHYWGYRNFELSRRRAQYRAVGGSSSAAKNCTSNHHTYPNSAKLSVKPWEFDMGWAWIRVLQTLGLAKPLYTGPKVARAADKTAIDMDTAWAVLNDRFRVMSRYAEEVVAPLVKQERKAADAVTRRLLRRAKSILCRHDMLVNERQRRQLTEVVGASPLLKTIYEKRLELAQLWSEKGRGAELLEALRTWCTEAEGDRYPGARRLCQGSEVLHRADPGSAHVFRTADRPLGHAPTQGERPGLHPFDGFYTEKIQAPVSGSRRSRHRGSGDVRAQRRARRAPGMSRRTS